LNNHLFFLSANFRRKLSAGKPPAEGWFIITKINSSLGQMPFPTKGTTILQHFYPPKA